LVFILVVVAGITTRITKLKTSLDLQGLATRTPPEIEKCAAPLCSTFSGNYAKADVRQLPVVEFDRNYLVFTTI
jgi:hypothetical protein